MNTPSPEDPSSSNPVSTRLSSHFPMAFQVAFGTDGSATSALPCLSFLMATAQASKTGAVVLVFPERGRVALAGAGLLAMARMQHEFAARLQAYAKGHFSDGDRVQVLHSKFVYEYGGLFSEIGDFLKLKIIDPKKPSWKKQYVPEPSARSLPASDVLRLVKTSRLKPLGKDNSPLGAWALTPLDRLLGIATGGNTALFGTMVYLVTERGSARDFASTIRVRSGEHCAAIELLGWGRVSEDGKVIPEQGTQVDPIVATSHVIDSVMSACTHAAPGGCHIILDGVDAALRNTQAFDSLAESQRVIVVADEEELVDVDKLASRGATVWKLEPDEVLMGIPAEHTAVASVDSRKTSLFADVTIAAAIAKVAEVAHEEVTDPFLEQAGSALHEVNDELSQTETASPLDDVVGRLFGLLLEASSWCIVPTPEESAGWRARLHDVTEDIRRQTHFLPHETGQQLAQIVEGLRQGAAEHGRLTPRLRSIESLVEQNRREGRRLAIAVRTPTSAVALRSALGQRADNLTILPAAQIPSGGLFDTILVASWPRAETLRRLLARHPAPRIQILSSGIEQRWLSRLLRSRETLRRRWKASPEIRRIATGGLLSDGQVSAPEPEEAELPSVKQLVQSWDRRLAGRRKGRPLDSGVDELDRRSARLVGFVGSGYAYLTPGHSVPVVTEIVRPTATPIKRVPMRKVDDLQVGDYVLFRSYGDHDLVVQFAEALFGSERYAALRAVADEWRVALRGISSNAGVVYECLTRAGLRRDYQTVRTWLRDPDLIAPKSDNDLELIARVSRSAAMRDRLQVIKNAVSDVRSAHIKAGMVLSEHLLNELPRYASELTDAGTSVQLTFGTVWILEVEDIGLPEERSYTEVNRLLGVEDF